jgi:hypothetical protein
MAEIKVFLFNGLCHLAVIRSGAVRALPRLPSGLSHGHYMAALYLSPMASSAGTAKKMNEKPLREVSIEPASRLRCWQGMLVARLHG